MVREILLKIAKIFEYIGAVVRAWAGDANAGHSLEVRQFAGAVQAEVCRRARRRIMFEKYGIVTDPAWDALLRILSSETDRNVLTVSHLSNEFGITTQTAARWLNLMMRNNLIMIVPSYEGHEHSRVHLSAHSRSLLKSYFLAK